MLENLSFPSHFNNSKIRSVGTQCEEREKLKPAWLSNKMIHTSKSSPKSSGSQTGCCSEANCNYFICSPGRARNMNSPDGATQMMHTRIPGKRAMRTSGQDTLESYPSSLEISRFSWIPSPHSQNPRALVRGCYPGKLFSVLEVCRIWMSAFCCRFSALCWEKFSQRKQVGFNSHFHRHSFLSKGQRSPYQHKRSISIFWP